MPEPLWRILAEFPILVTVGLVAWYAYNRVEAISATARIDEKKGFDARLGEVHELYKLLLAAKDQEIGRLGGEVKELTAAVQKLGPRIDALGKKLDG